MASEAVPLEGRTGLEPWKVSELPQPPVSRDFSQFGLVGPGIIVLGVSLGSGEWLLGPAAFVRYGLTLLWVTSAAAFLQAVFNMELIRYTLYTGEPVLTGFMRTRPGAAFWGWVYALFYFLQAGWPGWAGASAGAIFYLFAGRVAGEADSGAIYWIGVLTFLVCTIILLFGRRIERTLEILNWVLILFIFCGLAVICLIYAPPERWVQAVTGFLGYNPQTRSFQFLPPGADPFLIGAFAAYSGAGGAVNLMVSSWARDKGFGMGRVAGYIPSFFGGRRVKLAHSGTVFEVNPQSMQTWKRWWRIARVDQWVVFFCGALVGMALPAILYTTFFRPGEDILAPGIAAVLASSLTAQGKVILAFGIALIAIWVLLKTQLNIIEGMARSLTDILWSGSARLRNWRGGDVRYLYYGILAITVVWAVVALKVAQPIFLLQLSANMAGLVFVVSALHVLYINTRLLPEALRPPLWRRIMLVMVAVFYGAFFCLWIQSLF